MAAAELVTDFHLMVEASRVLVPVAFTHLPELMDALFLVLLHQVTKALLPTQELRPLLQQVVQTQFFSGMALELFLSNNNLTRRHYVN
jgi:hypothetical protein